MHTVNPHHTQNICLFASSSLNWFNHCAPFFRRGDICKEMPATASVRIWTTAPPALVRCEIWRNSRNCRFDWPISTSSGYIVCKTIPPWGFVFLLYTWLSGFRFLLLMASFFFHCLSFRPGAVFLYNSFFSKINYGFVFLQKRPSVYLIQIPYSTYYL